MKSPKIIYILILFIFISLWGIISFQIYNKSKEKLVNKEYATLRSLALMTENAISDFASKRLDDLGTLSSFPEIQNMTDKAKFVIEKYFYNHKNLIKAVTRLDTNGIIIYTTSKNKEEVIGKDVSYQKHNRIILKERVPYVSDIFKTVQGYWAISFAYPVFDDNGKFFGVISFLVDPVVISHKYLIPQSYLDQVSPYLISQDGRILYSPYKNEFGDRLNRFNKKNAKMKFFSSLTHCSGVVHSKLSYVDSTENNGVVKYLAAVSTINLPNRKWFLIITVPTTYVFKELDEVQNSFLNLNVLLLLFLFTASFFFYRIEKRANNKLIEQKALFETVSKKTGILVYNINMQKNSVIIEGRAENVIGYKSSELDGFTLDKMKSLIHPEDREMYDIREKEAILHKAESGTLEYRIRNKKGRYVYVEDNFSFIKNNSGEPIRKIGSLKDITYKKIAEEELIKYEQELENLVEERTKALEIVARDLEIELDEKKRREEELEEAKRKADAANKMKSEFLAQMSHEIRTPINTILSHASLFRIDLEDRMNEDMLVSFKAIENASQRIVRTVELILNMADLQTGSYEAHPHKYDLFSDILRRISMELMPIAEEKGLQLIIETPEVDTTAYVDEFSMRQILSNLIDNAIKYTEKGYVKVVFNRDEQNRLVISISDTGIGIKEEYLPNLFDAFSQEMQGYTRKFEGNGLGLALVKKYAIINNIDITVETEVGKGTTFNLIFNEADAFEEES